MKKESAVVKFKTKIELFYTTMKKYVSFFRRDKDRFEVFGITEEKINEVESKLEVFAEIPTDKEVLGNQTIATEEKEAMGKRVEKSITDIMTRVGNKFEKGSAVYRKFGANAVSKLDDGELGSCARRVCRVASLMISDLNSEGLTQEIINELHDLQAQYEKALGKQEDAIADRDIATEKRIDMANEIYDIMVKYCNTGRTIWQSENEAKYNDYIIYDTPSGAAEPETETETPSGQPV